MKFKTHNRACLVVARRYRPICKLEFVDHHPSASDKPPLLTKEASTSLFIHNLQSLYEIKLHLLDYLPLMSSKAAASRLKSTILHSAILLNSEVLRIEFIFKLLDYSPDKSQEGVRGRLDFKGYIMDFINGLESSLADFAFLNHLVMLDTMQIVAHKILKKLSVQFANNNIDGFLKENLNVAISNKQRLLTLMDLYNA